MRRLAVLGSAVALAVTALIAPSGGPATGGTTAATTAAAKEVPTRFAMHARGLGTKARSGDAPAGSDPIASKTINCTNMAGRVAENFVNQANIPDLGTANNVRTRIWTTKRGDTVASNARQTIESITLAETELGSLEVTGVASRSRAWHDAEGYHTSATAKVAGLVLDPAGEDTPPEALELPTPGNPVEIPGLLKIKLGVPKKTVTDRFGYTAINALDIQLTASGSRVKAGYSRARITEGVVSGLFNGYSAGVTGAVADPLLKFGKTPLHQMPCVGTDGEVTSKTATNVGLQTLLGADNVELKHRASQRRGVAKGFEFARVDKAVLGESGEVLIDVIKARVNVRREDGKLIRSARGTEVGSIVIEGEEFEPPTTDPIEVPGVVRIDPPIVEKIPGGLAVVGMRVTMLDGTGGVFDLAIARLRIGQR